VSLPGAWLEDAAEAERRAKGRVPALTVKTNPELGLEMLTAIPAAQTGRCQWVMGDDGVGRDGTFFDGVAALDLGYVADVPQETRVWRERLVVGLPGPRAQGRNPTTERAETPPETVLAIANALSPERWTRPTSQAGRKGPRIADWAVLRVGGGRAEVPGPDGWLVRRRSVRTGQLKT
jgi:hypothetical protein